MFISSALAFAHRAASQRVGGNESPNGVKPHSALAERSAEYHTALRYDCYSVEKVADGLLDRGEPLEQRRQSPQFPEDHASFVMVQGYFGMEACARHDTPPSRAGLIVVPSPIRPRRTPRVLVPQTSCLMITRS
jgi:hypothetical protein